MNNKILRRLALLAAFCGMLSVAEASAQTYVRYIKPEDIGTKALYADSVLTSIRLPQGVAKLDSYPKFNVAALELMQVLHDPDKELMQVWVCGSASPDGLWADNVRLSQARTDAAAQYLMNILDLPEYKIHKESLNEDWDRLAELVAASDMPYKYEVLYIIRTKEWGERKSALQKLDGGKAWRILIDDFFPKLRCVRFAIYCKWDPSKPHLSAPEPEPVKRIETATAPPVPQKADTVYVKDTVVMVKEVVYMPKETKEIKTKTYHDSPWMMGLKTDVLTDALALPQAGFEIQIARKMSFEMIGWYSQWAYINPCDEHKIYGFRPELRYWPQGVMQRGFLVGVHANLAWYALMTNDVDFYQNASLCPSIESCNGSHFDKKEYDSDGDGVKDMTNYYHDTPAWSVGATVGYFLPLGRNGRWGLEFAAGVGYAHYEQNHYQKSSPWVLVTAEAPQSKDYVGITRISVNLSYNFSLRKYERK